MRRIKNWVRAQVKQVAADHPDASRDEVRRMVLARAKDRFGNFWLVILPIILQLLPLLLELLVPDEDDLDDIDIPDPPVV